MIQGTSSTHLKFPSHLEVASPIQTLPPEMLALICQFLHQSSQNFAELKSFTWKSAILYQGWASSQFDSEEEKMEIIKGEMKRWQCEMLHLKQVAIQQVGFKSISAVSHFLSTRKDHLKVINLKDFAFCEDEIIHLLEEHPHLQQLIIHSPLVTPHFFSVLKQKNIQPKKLHLNFSLPLTQEQLLLLADHPIAHLKIKSLMTLEQFSELPRSKKTTFDVHLPSLFPEEILQTEGIQAIKEIDPALPIKGLKIDDASQLNHLVVSKCRLDQLRLKTLKLENCYNLTNRDLAWISKQEELEELSLRGISKISIEELTFLPSSLKKLTLDGLNFSEEEWDTFLTFIKRQLPHLQTLALEGVGDSLKDQHLAILKGCRLQSLKLNGSGFTSQGLVDLAHPSLTCLHLEYCIQIKNFEFLKLYPFLQELSLSVTQLTEEEKTSLTQNLPSLRSLRSLSLALGNEAIDETWVQALEELNTLVSLHLENCIGFTPDNLKQILQEKKCLTHLWLNGTDIDDEAVEVLQNYPLQELQLKNTFISSVESLKNLKVVQLSIHPAEELILQDEDLTETLTIQAGRQEWAAQIEGLRYVVNGVRKYSVAEVNKEKHLHLLEGE